MDQDTLTKADVLAGEKSMEVETLWGETETITLRKIPWRVVTGLDVQGAEFVNEILRRSLPEGETDPGGMLTVESLGRLQMMAMALSVTGAGGLKKIRAAAQAALAKMEAASSPSPASKPS